MVVHIQTSDMPAFIVVKAGIVFGVWKSLCELQRRISAYNEDPSDRNVDLLSISYDGCVVFYNFHKEQTLMALDILHDHMTIAYNIIYKHRNKAKANAN